jgi:hypothetical protein
MISLSREWIRNRNVTETVPYQLPVALFVANAGLTRATATSTRAVEPVFRFNVLG